MTDSVRPLTEGMIEKGGRNQGPSQILDRPLAPGAIERIKGNVFSCRYSFNDRVSIDGSEVSGVVVGFCFYPHGHQIQVSWWNNGAVVEQWFADWRLSPVEAR